MWGYFDEIYLRGLDEVELELEAGNELLFFFDLALCFFDEVLGSFGDVVRVHHASIECI